MRVRVLGGFGVDLDGIPVEARRWRLRKARALVAMLALAPDQRLHREQVLEALWPERDPVAAAQNLHQTLYVARRALTGSDANDLLPIRDDLVILSGTSPVAVDALEFEQAAAAALAAPAELALRAALDCYVGDLAPELAYQDSLSARRAELRDTHHSVLIGLASLLHEQGRTGEAQLLVNKVLEADALHEGAARILMQVLADTGRRSEALSRYEQLRDDLLEAFGTDPDPQTRSLFQELLTGSVPQARPAPRQQGRLPTSLTSFIGRERELDDVRSMLARTRMLTLTGAGGCGKTRLALEAARQVADSHPDGVWFVDLAALEESRLLPDVTAAALDLETGAGADPGQSLVDQLEDRSALIIFDNCEHLLGACAQLVTALLAGCPTLRVLATSRERLRIAGEVNLRVPSLDLPEPPTADVDPAALCRSSAVRLFVERAALVQPGFAVDDNNADAVAELCRRLDGMPLALELAAARVVLLDPRELVERLGDALAVLGHGTSGATRHQTLRAALQWSHDLLEPDEQVLLRRLAVFAGGFDLAAVEGVCATAPLDRRDVLDLLGRLVDKSLVLAGRSDHGSRYRLLETVRQFSRERLTAAGESSQLAASHCAHYLSVATTQDPERARGAVTEHPRLLDLEHDNLRAALRWSCESDPGSAISLAASLWRFWFLRGHSVEGAGWVERALAASPEATQDRARALIGLTGLDSRCGRSDRHQALGAEAVAVLEVASEPGEVALGRLVEGVLTWSLYDLDGARRIAADVEVAAVDLARPDLLAGCRWLQGMVALARQEQATAGALLHECLDLLDGGDIGAKPFFPVVTPCLQLVPVGARMLPYFEETMLLGRRVGTVQAAGYVLSALGYVERLAADWSAARHIVMASVERFAQVDDDLGRAHALHHLGCICRDSGDFDRAADLLREAGSIRRRLGDRRGELLTRLNEALLLARRGEPGHAQRSAHSCLAAFEAIGDLPAVAGSLSALGAIELTRGDVSAARVLFERAATGLATQGWLGIEAWTRLVAAELAAELGDRPRADRQLGRASAVFARAKPAIAMRRMDALREQLSSHR